ncbi:alpha/beta hydrolase [Antrihabitans sp. NCIMB 15449]|jgi:diacylglycerol O-acyltransferase / trehalose O-mycolyltransferase|uniref:Alpha/beta hydrolase n=1 Tax=Antrihabitans spumae TaxID=3373370 RepID=A0ABW7JHC5_9NOCA
MRIASLIRACAAPALLVVALTNGICIPISSAEPGERSRIVDVRSDSDRDITLSVYSAAMSRTFSVTVQRAADDSVPRPTLYLLTGVSGGVDGTQWGRKSDALQFLRDKNVNVVSPIGGPFSYYTDWRNDDPLLGRNKWKTFLTAELPPLIDEHFDTNGKNAIAGLSMSGASAFALAAAAPGLYASAASYSGCVQTSDPIGQSLVRIVVEFWGGANTQNMWGPPGDPMWAANDPFVHAANLRGMALYISTGTGLPGEYDVYDGPYSIPGPAGFANQLTVGGVIEVATDYCSRNLKTRLDQLGIGAHYNFRPTGTHTWGYWQDDFKDSWPVLAGPLGIR